MSQLRTLLSIVLCWVTTTALGQESVEPKPIGVEHRPTIESTIRNSLPYLAEQGQWWIDNKDCASCHRVTFTVWTHAAAAQAGFKVDQKQLTTWAEWCFDDLLADAVEGEGLTAQKNYSGAAQLLQATDTLGGNKKIADGRKQLLQILNEDRKQDGSWPPRGQLPMQKRDLNETTHVFTMWNAVFIDRVDHEAGALSAAAKFFNNGFQGKTTEWLATKLMTRVTSDERAKTIGELLGQQNEDGGWGWDPAKASDALATGQVLYVLANVPAGERTPAIGKSILRATEFLVSSQEKNGSWPVKGTKRNKQKQVEETARYWGTAWATIGLLESLKLKAN